MLACELVVMPDNRYPVFLTSFWPSRWHSINSSQCQFNRIEHPQKIIITLTSTQKSTDSLLVAMATTAMIVVIIHSTRSSSRTRMKSLNTRKYHSVACSFYNVTRSAAYSVLSPRIQLISWNPWWLLNAGFSFWYRTNHCGHLLRLALASWLSTPHEARNILWCATPVLIRLGTAVANFGTTAVLKFHFETVYGALTCGLQ